MLRRLIQVILVSVLLDVFASIIAIYSPYDTTDDAYTCYTLHDVLDDKCSPRRRGVFEMWAIALKLFVLVVCSIDWSIKTIRQEALDEDKDKKIN